MRRRDVAANYSSQAMNIEDSLTEQSDNPSARSPPPRTASYVQQSLPPAQDPVAPEPPPLPSLPLHHPLLPSQIKESPLPRQTLQSDLSIGAEIAGAKTTTFAPAAAYVTPTMWEEVVASSFQDEVAAGRQDLAEEKLRRDQIDADATQKRLTEDLKLLEQDERIERIESMVTEASNRLHKPLPDYQTQLMLMEQLNKARKEQDGIYRRKSAFNLQRRGMKK